MWAVLLSAVLVALFARVEGGRVVISRVSFGSGAPGELFKQREVVRTTRQNIFPHPSIPYNNTLTTIHPTTYKPYGIGVNNLNQGVLANKGFNEVENQGTASVEVNNQDGNGFNNNLNPGSNKFNQGPTNFNPGLSNFNQVSKNPNQGSSNFNQGSSNFNQGSTNFNQGSTNFDQASSNFNQGPNNFNQESNNFNTQGGNSINPGFNSNSGFGNQNFGNNFNRDRNSFNNAIGNQPSFGNTDSFGDNNQFTGSNFGPIEYSYNGQGHGRDENVLVTVPSGYGGESVKGSFSYKGSNGQRYVVSYTATSDEFKLQANKEKPAGAGYPASSPQTGTQINSALLCSLQGTCI